RILLAHRRHAPARHRRVGERGVASLQGTGGIGEAAQAVGLAKTAGAARDALAILVAVEAGRAQATGTGERGGGQGDGADVDQNRDPALTRAPRGWTPTQT